MERVKLWQVGCAGLLKALPQELFDELLFRGVRSALQVPAKVAPSLRVRYQALEYVAQTGCVPLVERLILVQECIERSDIVQKLSVLLRRWFDQVVLYAKLLENLGVIWLSVCHMGLLEWQLGARIVPRFRLIESPRCSQPKLILISHIRQITAISQLFLEQLVVAVKLALDSVVRLYAGHFAERLDIRVPECATTVLWCDIFQQVRVVGQAWAWYNGHVALVALNDDLYEALDVSGQEADHVQLPQDKLDCVAHQFLADAERQLLELGMVDLGQVHLDKRANVRVHLRHYEGVDVKKLGQTLHR